MRWMPPERIDLLRALPDQALVRPKRYCRALGLSTLNRHKAHGRTQGRLRDGFRVRAVVLLALDERLHIGAGASRTS